MSELPSPLKSPTPSILHDESGDTAAPWNIGAALEAIADPFISQVANAPLELCRHRMSASPSPLKSPRPAILQDEFGDTTWLWNVGGALVVIDDPFMSHPASEPVVLCRHRMSA